MTVAEMPFSNRSTWHVSRALLPLTLMIGHHRQNDEMSAEGEHRDA